MDTDESKLFCVQYDSHFIASHTINFSSSASQLKRKFLRDLGGFMGWFIILALGKQGVCVAISLTGNEEKIRMSTTSTALVCSCCRPDLQSICFRLKFLLTAKQCKSPETSLAIKKTNEFSRTAAGVAVLKRIT